jgi:hypothetical protein
MMGLRPESVGGDYPLTPMLVGDKWYVFDCHSGLVAGSPLNGPRTWAYAEGPISFIDLYKKGRINANFLVWAPLKEEPKPRPVLDDLFKEKFRYVKELDALRSAAAFTADSLWSEGREEESLKFLRNATEELKAITLKLRRDYDL